MLTTTTTLTRALLLGLTVGSISIASASSDSAASGTLPSILSISAGNTSSMTIDASSNAFSNPTVTLTISSNGADGFVVAATSDNDGLLKHSGGGTDPGDEVAYKISCATVDSTTVDSSQTTATAASAAQLTAETDLLTMTDPETATVGQESICTLAIHGDETDDSKFNGTYSDTITFTLSDS